MKSELDESFEKLTLAFNERQKRLDRLATLLYGLFALILLTTALGVILT